MLTKFTFISLLIFFSNSIFSQSRLLISNGAYIVIDNSAKVVVENSSTNAIENTGAGGIMTESEFDQVVWNIGNSTGSYVMPFVSQATIAQIPFTANITAAGIGAGAIRFSTYPGPVSDNDTYKPSDVTHMFDYNTNSINNSSSVIDRFWIIDALGYVTKPTATFQFTYRDIEHTVASNTITEIELGAQRFNSGTGQWGDYLPQGTTNTVANTTSGVPVSPANFFRSWTLSETSNPLSVDLSFFKTSCDASQIKLDWQTLSESNVSHFEIEYVNGNLNEVVAYIPAVGSIGAENYSYSNPSLRNGIYFLTEVDNNGNRHQKSSVSANCSSESNSIYFDPNNNSLFVSLNSDFEIESPLEIFDASGRVVFRTDVKFNKGVNSISIPELILGHGMYFVRIENQSIQLNERFITSK